MKRFATELEFISRINSDGDSITNIFAEENKTIQNCQFDKIYKLRPLSLTHKTFIASSMNTYVVKLKNHST